MTFLKEIQKNKPLRHLCTLGIGGVADLYTEVYSIEEMQSLLAECHQKKLRTFILGKGSNSLFDERGFSGLVIHNKIDFLEDKGEGLFYAGAGFSFSLLGSKTALRLPARTCS